MKKYENVRIGDIIKALIEEDLNKKPEDELAASWLIDRLYITHEMANLSLAYQTGSRCSPHDLYKSQEPIKDKDLSYWLLEMVNKECCIEHKFLPIGFDRITGTLKFAITSYRKMHIYEKIVKQINFLFRDPDKLKGAVKYRFKMVNMKAMRKCLDDPDTWKKKKS